MVIRNGGHSSIKMAINDMTSLPPYNIRTRIQQRLFHHLEVHDGKRVISQPQSFYYPVSLSAVPASMAFAGLKYRVLMG